MDYPAPVSRLIDELRRLPGIGLKSAQRIAFHLLKGSREEAARLSTAVAELLDQVRTCSSCNAITDQATCATCSDPARSDRVLCVDEEPHNLQAIERTRDFKGRSHVLHGVLSPLQGVGPDELRIQGLLDKSGKRDKGFEAEMREFCREVAQGGEPSMPYEDVVAVSRACILAARSLVTGEEYAV